MRAVVVDAGPLIALFDESDDAHEPARRWFSTNTATSRFETTEAVVTEVTHMLDFDVRVQTAFLRWAGVAMNVHQVDREHYAELAGWMDRYANVPMAFADATVHWLYAREPGARLFTFDERGFGALRAPVRGASAPRRVSF
jgi:predicted nucleic acid-binding protein